MPNTTSIKNRIAPEAFREYCRTRFERTVELTEKAIARLHAESQPVTLSALVEATRTVDEKGKGLGANTILRNPKAAELFRQHSPAYQARQHKTRRAKRRHSKASSDARATYHGLRSADFIAMVENLKTQIVEPKAHQERLQAERDEACRLRDQALQQNTRQLAMLTKSLTQVQLADKKP